MGPSCVVEERSVIESVVIGTVDLRMVAGGQGGHLVPVDRVEAEEELHFISNFFWCETPLIGPFLC